NSGSCGLAITKANPAQAIEMPDNPSPLNFFCNSFPYCFYLRDYHCFKPTIVPQVEAMFGTAIPSLINDLVYTSV
ncbi:hypothetical protein ACTT3N_003077, partial [Vibrio parahaemolyticus]